MIQVITCLLYTSDAADERSSVDLGGRRIIKKKRKTKKYNFILKKQNAYDVVSSTVCDITREEQSQRS